MRIRLVAPARSADHHVAHLMLSIATLRRSCRSTRSASAVASAVVHPPARAQITVSPKTGLYDRSRTIVIFVLSLASNHGNRELAAAGRHLVGPRNVRRSPVWRGRSRTQRAGSCRHVGDGPA
jgi:hypothetical protein